MFDLGIGTLAVLAGAGAIGYYLYEAATTPTASQLAGTVAAPSNPQASPAAAHVSFAIGSHLNMIAANAAAPDPCAGLSGLTLIGCRSAHPNG